MKVENQSINYGILDIICIFYSWKPSVNSNGIERKKADIDLSYDFFIYEVYISDGPLPIRVGLLIPDFCNRHFEQSHKRGAF